MFRLQVLVMGSVVAVGVLAMFVSSASHHGDHEHDEFLFYDFWSDKPATVVKDHFKGTTVIKSLKVHDKYPQCHNDAMFDCTCDEYHCHDDVISECTCDEYQSHDDVMFDCTMVKNDHSEALKSFNLPNDAENIRVFTIETLCSFFSHFSIHWPTTSLEHQNDTDLTFLERTWHPRGMTQEQFIQALHDQAGSVSPISEDQIFTPTAGLPVKFFFFLTRNRYSITELFLKHTSALGGPGNLEIHTLLIFNI